MKKNWSNRIKKIIFTTLFTVCLGWGVLCSTTLTTVTATNKVSGNDIVQNYYQVPYEKSLNSLRTDATTPVIDFRNDKKDAVDWSNENYPQISNIVKTSEEVSKVNSINNQLRTKYLNRADLYSPKEELADLDNSFITQAAQDITLYANLKTEDFGINSIYFYYNPDRVFENMLKETQYGIDDGYFIGDLTAQPLDSSKRESVQIKLTVPKGTRLIRVGSENESKYMIPRGNTFEYTEKNLDKTGTFSHVYITARLVDRDKLSGIVKEKQAIINNELDNKFNISPNVVKLVPLGLNAGNVISNSQEVAIKPFNIMENNG